MTPKVRFRAEYGTPFPDWEEKKIGDLTKPYRVRNKNRLSIEKYSINNTTGFVPQAEQFDNAGYLKNVDTSASMIAPPNYFAYNPARIDIGSIGYQNLGHDVQISPIYEVFFTNEHLNDNFFWTWLHTSDFHNAVLRLQEGGVRLCYPYSKLQITKIWLPSLAEQEKIASFFYALDNLISASNDRLNQLQKFKKSMLQKIFSREVRFRAEDGSEFPGWEEKKLKDILKSANKEAVDPTVFKKITISAHRKGISYASISHKMKDTRPFYRRYQGELIVGKQSCFNGSIAIVPEEFDGCICSNAIMNFIFNNGVDKTFVLEYISYPDYLSCHAHLAEGGCQKEISEQAFLNLPIKLPSYLEQQKITSFFKSIDKLITATGDKLAKYQDLKKAMLQQLFA